MIRLYFIGLGILITAILANALAGKLGLKSWYDVLTTLGAAQKPTLHSLDVLWLIVVYPLTLGLGYRLGALIYQKLMLLL